MSSGAKYGGIMGGASGDPGMDGGIGGAGGSVGGRVPGFAGDAAEQRDPQSEQSVPSVQWAYSLPGPPSSQSPSSEAVPQSSSQQMGGEAGDGGARGGTFVLGVPVTRTASISSQPSAVVWTLICATRIVPGIETVRAWPHGVWSPPEKTV
eukprot:4279679-Prymnesium_polylepis.2